MKVNDEMLACLVLCVEHKTRRTLADYVICEMAEIIETASRQPCDPQKAMEMANEQVQEAPKEE